MKFSVWMLWWIAAVAVLRFASLGGAVSCTRFFAYAGKQAGGADSILLSVPLFRVRNGSCRLCSGIAASLSAVEEFFILLTADTLERDRKSLFVRQ